MQWDTMKLEGEGAVRHLVFNRPEVHNAINSRFLEDVIGVCGVLDGLPELRALVVRGEGASFSAGADLKEQGSHGSTKQQMIHRARLGRKAINALTELSVVTIAAVHGHAIGGGACMAAACDFRVAADSARVSVRESSLGLSLSWNAIPAFVHLVGATRAKEMILFGDTYEPEILRDYGFFSEVVPAEALLEAAGRWAERVLRQPPLPVQMGKASINAVVRAMDQAVFHLDDYGLALTGGSADSAKAKKAFFKGENPPYEFD